MKSTRSIRDAVGAAACSLIGLASLARADVSELESSVLVYTERDGRVNAFESLTRSRQVLANGSVLSLGLTVDVLTGASPNGATPSTDVQTFTRPSGVGSYIVPPGELPLDATFQDNRGAIEIAIELPTSRVTTMRLGGRTSVEYDYVSIGADGFVSRDFNRGNTTVSAGASVDQDYLDPEGGAPIPFASMRPVGARPWRQAGNQEKTVIDGLVGVTQVLSRRTLVRLNYTVSHSRGYLTDPFKMISVVDAAVGPSEGATVGYVYENRPDTRTKHSAFVHAKHHLARDIVEGSYRFMRDDWGIQSHTAEFKYLWAFDPGKSLQPQLRYYHQSAADFHVFSLHNDTPHPEFASSDYRLGDFHAVTLALKYGFHHSGGEEVGVRLGYYLQVGDRSPPEAIGVQRGLDLFPTLHALIAQISYSVTW